MPSVNVNTKTTLARENRIYELAMEVPEYPKGRLLHTA